MESKPMYPNSNLNVPPPSYDAAMGLQPPGPQQQLYPTPPTQQDFYTPPIPQPQVTVPVPVFVHNIVGPTPCLIVCPNCGQNIITTVEYEPSTKTHMMAIILCVLGCFCCACLPYCMDSCKTTNHYCPRCRTFVGSYDA